MALAEECVVRSIAGTDMGVDALCIGIVVPRLRAGGVEVEFEIGADLGDAARPRGAVTLHVELAAAKALADAAKVPAHEVSNVIAWGRGVADVSHATVGGKCKRLGWQPGISTLMSRKHSR